MARKRMIHPEFFLSDDIAALSTEARLTFIGLWCHVDDDGRAKDSPAAVCAAVWGMDPGVTPSHVANLLDELETVGSLCRYEVDEQRYMHIPSWSRWQSISHPADPRIPPCLDHGGRPAKADGRGKRKASSPRTAETYGESRRVSPQVVSQFSSESAVEVRPGAECSHGDPHPDLCQFCLRGSSGLRAVSG